MAGPDILGHKPNRHGGMMSDRLKQTKYAALRKFRLTNNQGDLQSYKDSRNSFKKLCKLKKKPVSISRTTKTYRGKIEP